MTNPEAIVEQEALCDGASASAGALFHWPGN
jgi:hypothetical protein